jgi:hypothetical protein
MWENEKCKLYLLSCGRDEISTISNQPASTSLASSTMWLYLKQTMHGPFFATPQSLVAAARALHGHRAREVSCW